jgi:uncharacterized membrane protein (DUF2068 family)
VEALKGVLVLLVATGLVALVHQDLGEFAALLVRHSHLNPASKYPQIFVDAASHLDQPRLIWLALGALAYASVRLVEAYGLFWERAWAEWLAALSGGLYLPAEIVRMVHRPSGLGVTLFLVNLAVVGVMVRALVQRRRGGH